MTKKETIEKIENSVQLYVSISLCGEAIISENMDPLFDVCSLILA